MCMVTGVCVHTLPKGCMAALCAQGRDSCVPAPLSAAAASVVCSAMWQQWGFVHLFVNRSNPQFAEKSKSQVPAIVCMGV